MVTKKVFVCRHMRLLQLLYIVGGDLASPRTEVKLTFFLRGGEASYVIGYSHSFRQLGRCLL